MTDVVNTNTSSSPASGNASCPFMELPPELRQLIYEYYFEDTKLPRKSYLGLLHFSSGVRAETAPVIYREWFTGMWLVLNVSEGYYKRHNTRQFKLTIETCSQIHKVNRNIKFGLRFVVNGYSSSIFLRFVDSFFGLQAEEEDSPRPEYCSLHDQGEQMLICSTSEICYTYRTLYGGRHELKLFGTLAKLDWSKFSFEFPTPTQMEVEDTDEEPDTELDSEEENRALYCDDDIDDGGDSEVDSEDGEGGIFADEDEASSLDVDEEGFMLDSGNDGEDRQIYDENEAVLLEAKTWTSCGVTWVSRRSSWNL